MIAVDLYLLVIGLVGIFLLEWGTQLYITLIETVVLALLTMILSTIEILFFLNPGNLEYTWHNEKQGRWRV